MIYAGANGFLYWTADIQKQIVTEIYSFNLVF